MKNRFPGICTGCGTYCGAGQGVAGKSQFGKWRVQHVSCAADPATKAATALAPPKRQKLPPRRKFAGINPW
jgi:hypothetical protein